MMIIPLKILVTKGNKKERLRDEYINSDYIISFWDETRDKVDGVCIAMPDDQKGVNTRHFSEFAFASEKLTAETLYKMINESHRK